MPLIEKRLLEPLEVPLLFNTLGRYVASEQVFKDALSEPCEQGVYIGRFEQLVALLVNHFALFVGNVVVFEKLLADIEVTSLDLALSAFNGTGDQA